jgi:hypothetical protein
MSVLLLLFDMLSECYAFTLYFIAMSLVLFCVVCWVVTWPIVMLGAVLFSGARMPENPGSLMCAYGGL